MRDAEKVNEIVKEALNNLRDAAAFEWVISDKDKALFEVATFAVETLYASLPQVLRDPNDNKYSCQPYGVAKCDVCLNPFDDCKCDNNDSR